MSLGQGKEEGRSGTPLPDATQLPAPQQERVTRSKPLHGHSFALIVSFPFYLHKAILQWQEVTSAGGGVVPSQVAAGLTGQGPAGPTPVLVYGLD